MVTSPLETVLVDSNIPIYAAGREDPYLRPCQQVLRHIVAGHVRATTNAEVHQEILHRYRSIGQAPKALLVSFDFQSVVPDVLPVSMDDVARARELASSYPLLPTRDLIHVAVMLNNGIRTILSADRHFDQVREISRLDPMVLASR